MSQKPICPKCGGTIHRAICLICEMLEDAAAPGGTQPDGWPLTSEAAAVHPKIIPQAMERDKKMGVPTEYTKSGSPIFRDRAHRRQYLKAHNMHDRNGGYGDG